MHDKESTKEERLVVELALRAWRADTSSMQAGPPKQLLWEGSKSPWGLCSSWDQALLPRTTALPSSSRQGCKTIIWLCLRPVCALLHRWKLVHGDVFRPPRYLELLAALVGTGVQLALLVLSVILITIAGAYHLPDPPFLPKKDSCSTTVIECEDIVVDEGRVLLNSMKLAGTLFTERGTIVTVFIICYALTSFVAGYVR